MTEPSDIMERLRTEADLCRNETADDIAVLLDQGADEIERLRAVNKLSSRDLLSSVITVVMSTKQADRDDACRKLQRHIMAVEAERDALWAELAQIKAQASDATEYVLAQINKDLRAENEAVREDRDEMASAEVAIRKHCHRLQAENERLRSEAASSKAELARLREALRKLRTSLNYVNETHRFDNAISMADAALRPVVQEKGK